MVSRALLLLLLAVPLPTAPTRYVSDPANLLEDGRENALNERLAQYERETSNQLLVYVDRRLPEGTTLEEMGAEAIRTWKVGQEKKDNGAILFFFVDDRESRIEVGYGLEGTLTDARSKRILVGLRDDLRAGDYVSAAERGAEQIIATIADPTDPPLTPQPVVQEARAAEPNTMNGPPLPFYLAVFAFLGVILVVWYKVRHSEEESRGLPHLSLNLGGGDTSSSSSDDWSSSSSDSSSSSSSSSDFSGGGGSGGGGGASDRW